MFLKRSVVIMILFSSSCICPKFYKEHFFFNNQKKLSKIYVKLYIWLEWYILWNNDIFKIKANWTVGRDIRLLFKTNILCFYFYSDLQKTGWSGGTKTLYLFPPHKLKTVLKIFRYTDRKKNILQQNSHFI